MMSLKGVFLAATLSVVVGLGFAQAASAQVRIDIPARRPSGGDGPSAGDVIGGLLALKDGYDRSRRGRICVSTYDDANGDGARDRGEGGLPGWTFSITNAAGTVVAEGQADSAGRFCNTGTLQPGAYSVSESPGGQWVNTEPGAPRPWTKAVVLPADRSVSVQFGNCHGDACGLRGGSVRGPSGPAAERPGERPRPEALAQVCVTKFNDMNGNGVRDAGEWLLSNWAISVTENGAVVASGWTDNQGQYCTGLTLPAGHYMVAETVTGGWAATTPGGPSRPAILAPGQTWTWAFGNKTLPMTYICITKFNDLNGDGVRQTGEPGVPNWPFTIAWPPSSGVSGLSTTHTGSKPTAATACVGNSYPAGVYTVAEVPLPGWMATTPGGASQTFTLTPNTPVNLIFGNYKPPATARVCVVKYNDLNGNGVRDPGEPSLPGWTFLVKGPNGATLASIVTGTDGRFCTPPMLPAGPVSIVEALQAGWVSTDPGGPAPTKALILVPGQMTQVAFGNRRPPPPPPTGRLCVSKFHDLDGNGVRAPAEPLLAGWQFHVTGPSGPITLTTAANGSACTPSTLLLGSYVVTEVMQAGWTSTTPGGASPQRTVAVTAALAPNVMFGNHRDAPPAPGVVCIVKYNDIDQDAVFDTGEARLPGWQFNLKTAAGAAVATVTTGPVGRVCRELPPGAYAAFEIPQPGWANSDPVGPALDKPFTIAAGQTVTLVFGNYQPPILRFRKVVLSNAPGGGFPLTGLTSGANFQVLHNCVLGNQTGGNMTLVPANGVSPLAGYTGNSVGSVCTASETPPPGRIAFAPCPTGQGHWATPIVSPQPLTIAPGMNEITVTNQFVCEKTPAPSGKLCVHKFNDLNGDASYALSEPGLAGWQFTVTGPSGPITLVTGANGRACTNANLILGTYTITETPQAGWVSTLPGGATPQQTGAVTAAGTPSFNFGNRLVTPPTPPRLTISKSFDNSCTSVQGITNPCVFRIRILNVDTVAYVGPAAFSDTVGFMGGVTVANSTILTAPLPPGWSCSTNGPPISCSGSVNLAPGQFVDIVLTMDLFHPVMPLKNCVTLTAPINNGPACVAF